MKEIIIKAIQSRQVLAFSYNNIARVVEPHALGVSLAGNDVLRCYQIGGVHVTSGHEWDFFDVAKITGLRTTGTFFSSARPGYKRGDKHMRRIYAEL